MRIAIDSKLSSISAFSTDLKEFKLYTNCSWISEQFQILNLCWSSGIVRLAINPEGYKRRQWKVLTAELLGQCCSPLLQHRLGSHRLIGQASTNNLCFLVCSSLCWQQQACLRYNFWRLGKVFKTIPLCDFVLEQNEFSMTWLRHSQQQLQLTKQHPARLCLC